MGKKRRTRTDHRGVKLLARKLANGKVVHVARWINPDTGKPTQESLTNLAKARPPKTKHKLTTAEGRRDWAIEKSKEVREREAAIARGDVVLTTTGVKETVTKYLEGLTRKALKTVQLYKQGLDHLIAWARNSHVSNIEELDAKRLTALGKYLHEIKAKVSAKGKGIGRGTAVETEKLLAPATVNQFIRAIRTFLRYCRLADLTPHLTSDMIRDRLPFADNKRELPRYLKAKEIRVLVKAAQRHDAETFTATRDRNQHPKHRPIAPFIVGCLLTGMRFSELATLRWADVDLDAGVIELSASATKTRQGRRITLKESPAFWTMLETLNLQSESAYVFGAIEEVNGTRVDRPMARTAADSARKRLSAKRRMMIGKGRNPSKREPRDESYGAPAFCWHDLRRTCGTYLTCAPNIHGAASAFMSAKRLGHSVTVAERFYVGAVDVDASAKTLEAAMGIDDLLPTRKQESALSKVG